ncbi:protein TASOR-like [Centroberyx gerrardi]
MDGDSLARREAARPRQASAAEVGATASQQDGELTELQPARESQAGLDRPRAPGGGTERRNPATALVHQRHMPMEPLKFHIPRKTKEKRALFQYVSPESREHEDMMTILSSSYRDTGSAGCFTYCKPRLVHSELLEKEFVERRKEMKADGRTDKELEESYCFLLADTVKLPWICEKGLCVGHSWITALGNPSKGVYLSKYSDLLQINPFTPGATGEIIIFKVMKGKVKSIYDNMSKNLLDPTPRFDCHLSKNASKVTSLTSYRAFELTQQYFYEYSFDELRQRPRQVCPYVAVSFQFKGKDSPLPSKPLAPLRLNSQSSEGGKERAQYTVWTGDLVKGDQLLFQLSLRSFSPPFLPYRLPEKLEVGWLMRLDHVTRLLPPTLFSWNLYAGSHEVVKNGQHCSLLEVTDRSRTGSGLTTLLQELETKRVVLVTPLADRGFLFLLSSVHMATPPERTDGWKRCLQALFVFPETRDVAKFTSRCAASSHDASVCTVMPRLSLFLPALHHALVKARASPPAELSAGVELQARDYLSGRSQGQGQVRLYPMGEYDSKLDERGKLFPAPKHHRLNMDGYLRSYLYSPALYLLSVARAKQMVEAHCGPEEPQDRGGRGRGEQRKERSGAGEEPAGNQKAQQLIDLVLACKRNAEREVGKEGGGGGGGQEARGRKRKQEQEMAERTLKYLRRASQEEGRAEGNQGPASLCSLSSMIGSVGLKDVDLRKDGSEAAAKLLSLLTDLNQTAMGTANHSLPEEQEDGQSESWPFDRLATKLGLPTNCDIDLRKQEELEEQAAGSISSLEGFSPGSHSGEPAPRGAATGGGGGGGALGRTAGGDEEEEGEGEIPWVLIPITGLRSERYSQRERDIPQDPRFLHVTMATGVTAMTSPRRRSPTPSPEPSPPPSPSQCPSPEPNELSPVNEDHSLANKEQLTPVAPWESAVENSQDSLLSGIGLVGLKDVDLRKDGSEAAAKLLSLLTGVIKEREEKPQMKEEEKEEPSLPPAPERRRSLSPQPAEKREEDAEEEKGEEEGELLEEGSLRKPDKKEEAEADETKEEVAAVEMQVADEEKGEVIEVIEGSSSPSPPSSPPPRPLRDVDSIVEEHLGNFSSEIQHLLQEESVRYSFPCPAPNTQPSTHTHTLPQTLLTPFSQYVSFYSPCPPVQDYVSSLKDSISSVVIDSQSCWPSHRANANPTDADATLASSVGAFVASIRAANANVSRDSGVSANCGEATAASLGQKPPLSRGGDLWPSNTVTQQFPTTTNNRIPPVPRSHVPLSVSVCPSPYNPSSGQLEGSPLPGSVYPPTTTPASHAALVPAPPPWTTQQHLGLEVSRTVAHEAGALRQMQDDSSNKSGSVAGSDSEVMLPGLGGTEPADPLDPLAEPPGAGPAPPPAALSSLISQLRPEVFSSLVEIIKDVRRNSLQFYIHCAEPEDLVYDQVKEYLLKQGNVEQSPVAFLDQENSDNRLLVIIQNKDIAEHIHKIPGLVSLKRHPSVVFVGIDSLEDVRNNSYNELFVSGGCIVSDEFVLNPDFITHERLAALLMFLEQQSSPESVWRWRVHCKTQKKLKEQARFKRDAASILDVLSAYQKRLIVEFLPYHHCDMMSRQSPDLDCLIELQGRYTQHRHTIFLTERRFEMFPNYSSSGIIIANIDDIMHNFTSLVGNHDIKDKQPITDDPLAPKGLGSRQLSHEDSALGSELSPSSFPEHHPTPHHLLQLACPVLPLLSDQLVPESATPPSSSSSSSNEGPQHHSDPDFEALRLAISQLRAERQAQQQQRLDPHAEFSINPLQSFLPNPTHPEGPKEQIQLTPGGRTTPPVGQGGLGEQIQLTPGRKAVAATLESIHSALEPERREEKKREAREGVKLPMEEWGSGSVAPVRVTRLLGGDRYPSDSDMSLCVRQDSSALGSPTDNTPSTNQNTGLAATVSSDRTDPVDSASDRRETADDRGEPAFPNVAKEAAVSCSTTAGPAGANAARDRQPGQEQSIGGEAAPPGNQDCRNTNSVMVTASGTVVTSSVTMVTDQEDTPHPALPRLQQLQRQIQQHQLQLQQQNQQQLNQQLHQTQQQQQHQQQQQQQLHQTPQQQHQLQQQNQQQQPQSQSHPQPQRGGGLLPHPSNLPLFPSQPFPPGPMLGPLATLGGMRGFLGPGAVWPGGLGPAGAALVWGFQQAGREFPAPGLLGGYHTPGGQAGNRYRGGQRGGFNGM